VAGTELTTWHGRATGMVEGGVLVGRRKAEALREMFDGAPDVGLGDSSSDDHPFMAICKVSTRGQYAINQRLYLLSLLLHAKLRTIEILFGRNC
jgi:hypothetical protein